MDPVPKPESRGLQDPEEYEKFERRMREGPGSWFSPRQCLEEAIRRALGWISETKLRAIVEEYTGHKMSLGEANRFSADVADAVIERLRA